MSILVTNFWCRVWQASTAQPHFVRAPPSGNFWICGHHLFRTRDLYTTEDPMKAETDQVFKVLKARNENEVRNANTAATRKIANHASRLALTAKLATRHGLGSRLACIFISIVPTCTVIWVCIPRLFGTSTALPESASRGI